MQHFQYLNDSGLGARELEMAINETALSIIFDRLNQYYLTLATHYRIQPVIHAYQDHLEYIRALVNEFNNVNQLNRPEEFALYNHDILGRIVGEKNNACGTCKNLLELHGVRLDENTNTIRDQALKEFHKTKVSACFRAQREAIINLQRE